jgi:hypothetical protein
MKQLKGHVDHKAEEVQEVKQRIVVLRVQLVEAAGKENFDDVESRDEEMQSEGRAPGRTGAGGDDGEEG